MTGALPDSHREQLDALADTYWWHAHRVAAAAQALAKFSDAPAKNYLDAGCGGGATTRRLAHALVARGVLREMGEVRGLDADERCRAAAEAQGVLFETVDLARAASSAATKFELFSALDVLEHVDTPGALLRHLSAALTEGALGAITVPAFQGLFSDWDRALGHRRRYDAAALTAELSGAGFETLWSSYLYSFAAPAARLRRSEEAEFPLVPGWANALLKGACAAERLLLRVGRLPVGTSLLVVVRKAKVVS